MRVCLLSGIVVKSREGMPFVLCRCFLQVFATVVVHILFWSSVFFVAIACKRCVTPSLPKKVLC